jgi:hypothetical protein
MARFISRNIDSRNVIEQVGGDCSPPASTDCATFGRAQLAICWTFAGSILKDGKVVFSRQRRVKTSLEKLPVPPG